MLYLPYGRTKIPFYEADATVLCAKTDELGNTRSGEALVREAMARPVGSTRLHMLAEDKQTCTLIISDHTRPVPSRDILPPMLEELRTGNPAIEITLLVATGCHRGPTREELVEKLGETIASAERIVVHNADNNDENVEIGVLPSGASLLINRIAAETDLLIAEGFIEPHFFAGFSGGRKSVLPGVSGKETVLGNHCGAFIDNPFSRAGILTGNPIHADMKAAARLANLAYIVNVVIDEEKHTVAAFAGEPIAAHAAGCAFLRPICEVFARPSDIVITTNGGAPLDQNLYQCVKGLSTAEAAANTDGVLIIAAECADGVGGDGFYRSLKECNDVATLYDAFLATPQCETIPDQWQSQILARILTHNRVIFVSRAEMEPVIQDMKMEYAPSVDAALRMAKDTKGENASITVIPNGVSMIVRPLID